MTPLTKNNRLTLLIILAGLLILAILVLGWLFFPLPVPGNLQQRQWQLISVETAEGSVLWTPAPGEFTLEFQGYTVRGRSSCNTYGGNARYTWFTRSMTIASVFSTLMACLPLEGQDLNRESDFFQALASVRTYALRGDKLYLYFDNSTNALIFQ